MQNFGREGGFIPPEEFRSPQEKQEDETSLESVEKLRRNILLKKITASMLGVSALFAAGFVAFESRGSTKAESKIGVEKKEKTQFDEYEEYMNELKKIFGEIKSSLEADTNLGAYDKKIAEYEAISEYFSNNPENLEKLNTMIDVAVGNDDPNILPSKIYNTLAGVDAQDLFYDRLVKTNKYKEFVTPDGSLNKSTLSGSLKEYHLATPASSFLPNGEQVSVEEMDPRLFQAESVEEIAKSIEHKPQWSGHDKSAKFKQAIDDASVRQILQNPEYNLNLAQAYSFIKIAIDKQEGGDARGLAEIIEEIREKQDLAMEQEVLGQNTENFIFVAGHDKRLNDDISGFASSYEEIGKKFGAKNIKGFASSEGVEEEFKKVVTESQGATTLYIDAHSGPNSFLLNEKEKITSNEFAKVLLERVKKGESLDNVNIILGGCDSFELQSSILEELKKQTKEKKFKKMELPNFITSVTGSSPVEQNAFRGAFFELASEMEKIGKPLKVEDFVKTMQPKVYGNGADMGLFIGEKGGTTHAG